MQRRILDSQEVLLGPTEAERALPKNLRPGDLDLFRGDLQWSSPAIPLLHLDDVLIFPDGLILRHGRPVAGSSVAPGPRRAAQRTLKSLVNCRLPRRRFDEHVFWITDNWSHNYFHWLTDALPRLFAIRDRVADIQLLLPARFQNLSFVEPSLRPFRVGRVVFMKPKESWICSRVTMPAHTAVTGNYNEEVIRAVGQALVTKYAGDSMADRQGRIYISRQRALRRRIVNEQEIISILRDFDFTTVCPEDYSFEEQVKIFSSARLLISNHGAGLTNMLFMPEGGRVLELRRERDRRNNCFFALASALKLEYFYQLGASGPPTMNPRSRPVVVDGPAVRRTLIAFVDGL
jgi:Glycosyltransferase 61